MLRRPSNDNNSCLPVYDPMNPSAGRDFVCQQHPLEFDSSANNSSSIESVATVDGIQSPPRSPTWCRGPGSTSPLRADDKVRTRKGPCIVEEDIRDRDVLCGRDKRANAHSGNARFRSLVRTYRDKYQQTDFRKVKNKIARDIIEAN